ncbi:MAG: hypothetical protein ABH821_01860 [archaeon]
MKKLIVFVLLLSFVLILFSGCIQETVPETTNFEVRAGSDASVSKTIQSFNNSQRQEIILTNGVTRQVMFVAVPESIYSDTDTFNFSTAGNASEVLDKLVIMAKANEKENTVTAVIEGNLQNECITIVSLPEEFVDSLSVIEREMLAQKVKEVNDFGLSCEQMFEVETSLQGKLNELFNPQINLMTKLTGVIFLSEKTEIKIVTLEKVIEIFNEAIERVKREFVWSNLEVELIVEPQEFNPASDTTIISVRTPRKITFDLIIMDTEGNVKGKLVENKELGEDLDTEVMFPLDYSWNGKIREESLALNETYYVLLDGKDSSGRNLSQFTAVKLIGNKTIPKQTETREQLIRSNPLPKEISLTFNANKTSQELSFKLVNPRKIEIMGKEVLIIPQPKQSYYTDEWITGIPEKYYSVELTGSKEPFDFKINFDFSEYYKQTSAGQKLKGELIFFYFPWFGGEIKVPVRINLEEDLGCCYWSYSEKGTGNLCYNSSEEDCLPFIEGDELWHWANNSCTERECNQAYQDKDIHSCEEMGFTCIDAVEERTDNCNYQLSQTSYFNSMQATGWEERPEIQCSNWQQICCEQVTEFCSGICNPDSCESLSYAGENNYIENPKGICSSSNYVCCDYLKEETKENGCCFDKDSYCESKTQEECMELGKEWSEKSCEENEPEFCPNKTSCQVIKFKSNEEGTSEIKCFEIKSQDDPEKIREYMTQDYIFSTTYPGKFCKEVPECNEELEGCCIKETRNDERGILSMYQNFSKECEETTSGVCLSRGKDYLFYQQACNSYMCGIEPGCCYNPETGDCFDSVTENNCAGFGTSYSWNPNPYCSENLCEPATGCCSNNSTAEWFEGLATACDALKTKNWSWSYHEGECTPEEKGEIPGCCYNQDFDCNPNLTLPQCKQTLGENASWIKIMEGSCTAQQCGDFQVCCLDFSSEKTFHYLTTAKKCFADGHSFSNDIEVCEQSNN